MQLTIEINNSYSQIKNMTVAQYKGLRKLLSYSPNADTAYFSGGFVQTRYLIDKHGYFPTGLIDRVLRHLGDQIAYDGIIKKCRPPQAGGFYELKDNYLWQANAVRAALNCNRGIISAVTGSGKSRVIKQLALSLGVKTLVVVPSLEIKLQLSETLKDLKNVTILNIDSKALKTAKDFDCLIIDEGHHVAAKTYQDLNKRVWGGIYYRFFLTATPFRNQAHEQLLFEGIAGGVIYELTYKEAVKEGYICPIEAYYLKMPELEVYGHTWKQVYNELVVHHEHRNNVIGALMLRLNAAGASTLCLVKEIAHGQSLSHITGLPFANGQDEDSRRYIQQFNTGQIKTLIGTAGILGEGVDTKPCEYVIIAGLGKAKSAFMQQVGRCIRAYPGKESGKVIIIRDRSHRWTISHFNAQKKILLEEYNTKVLELD